ncbi:hypothetical protein JCM9279_006926 [Rhodotorula babjevae]
MPHAISDEKKPAPTEFKPNKADQILPGTRARLEAAGIDLSTYPTWPDRPSDVKLAASVRARERKHVDPGARADKDKKALFSAAKEVKHLSANIGTEIVGLQLSQLSDQQKDELALLIAERTVVFFRDQDLTPQAQRDLGAYFGQVEVHPTAAQVPGLPGVSIIWSAHISTLRERGASLTLASSTGMSTDLTHEKAPPGITHLHLDEVPELGGDTYWASGWTAYDHLSPAFRKIVDGLKGVYRSAHSYPNPDDPSGPRVPIEREHPLVRTHPATGWKSLFVNRKYTLRIVGFDKPESDLLLNYLFDLYEKSLDAQIRFKWTPRTSALWDNRISCHAAVYDVRRSFLALRHPALDLLDADPPSPHARPQHEGKVPRHGTRVSSLAEVPYFDPASPSRREALGLDKPEDFAYRAPREAY